MLCGILMWQFNQNLFREGLTSLQVKSVVKDMFQLSDDGIRMVTKKNLILLFRTLIAKMIRLNRPYYLGEFIQ